MELVFLGIGEEGIRAMRSLKSKIPGRYIAISSEAGCMDDFEEKIKYSHRLPLDSAISRICSKIKKATKAADIVFLLSEITGRKAEAVIPYIMDFIEEKIAVSVVWYPAKKHGQQGIINTLGWIGENSAVVAMPSVDFWETVCRMEEFVLQLLRMCELTYANADAATGKRILGEHGLLHLARKEFELKQINAAKEAVSWEMRDLVYNKSLDTMLDYCQSALLHLVIPRAMPQEKVSDICEFVFLRLGTDREFNFAISVDPGLTDSFIIELLATDAATCVETAQWF